MTFWGLSWVKTNGPEDDSGNCLHLSESRSVG